MWRMRLENTAHLLLGFVSHIGGLLDKLMLLIAVVWVAATLPDVLLYQMSYLIMLTAGQARLFMQAVHANHSFD